MKTVILAGGNGKRLYPATSIYSKHLVLLYDKPLIFYPITTAILAGSDNIAVVVRSIDREDFESLLGDGSKLGVNITFVEQSEPLGIVDGLRLCQPFINDDPFCLILGDNIFLGEEVSFQLRDCFNSGTSTVFSKEVVDPTHYGVAVYEAGTSNLRKIIEKPTAPSPSNDAITGLYVYHDKLSLFLPHVKKNEVTGEYGVTDLNNLIIQNSKLNHVRLTEHSDWFDGGKPETLFKAAKKIADLESLRNHPVGCPYYAAFTKRRINLEQLEDNYKYLSPEYGQKIQLALTQDTCSITDN